MSLISKIWIKMIAEKVGTDASGNAYYQTSSPFMFKRKRRFIVYKKSDQDPSLVPTSWFRWLHYQSEAIPTNREQYPWEQPFPGNKSGSNEAYFPPGYALSQLKQGKEGIEKHYQAWKP